MPIFFFDLNDGGKMLPDQSGSALEDVAAAREQATKTLAEIALDTLPGCLRRNLSLEVKDEARNPLFRASLSFALDQEHSTA